MKALTVQQPWAWAIVHGGKDVENRTQLWAHRGPLAIHAGARWSDRGGRSGLIWDALRNRYGWPTGPATARDDRRPGFDSIRPLGAIIGTVDLVDAHQAEPEPDCNCMVPYLDGAGNHSPGCDVFKGCCDSEWAEHEYAEHGGRTRRQIVHLVLADPRRLPEPIPCRGALGLWTTPDDVTEQLQAVLT